MAQAALLSLCAPATAASISWTGGSLLGPYWHHALNWAGGQVPGGDDRALLGNADTFISQAIELRSFQGTGTLTVQASSIGLYGPPGIGSLIGSLRLENSSILGNATSVRAGSLWLQDALVGVSTDASTSVLRADNTATISGDLTVHRTWALRLDGQTTWAAGSGDIRFARTDELPQAALWIGAGGVFRDEGAGAGTRVIRSFAVPSGIGNPTLQIDGVYRKSGGSGNTRIDLDLAVAGELAVDQGSVTLYGNKAVSGRLTTAAGATLQAPTGTLALSGARVVNQGTVEIGAVGLRANATFDAATQWTGSGTLRTLGDENAGLFTVITNETSVQTGLLHLGGRTQLLGSGSFNTAALSILPSADSFVALGSVAGAVGPTVTASGPALLGQTLAVSGGARLALNGASRWDDTVAGGSYLSVRNPAANTPGARSSRVAIGAAGVFSDEACTAPCDRSIESTSQGGEFINAGAYIKRGEHRTSIGSGMLVSNSGRFVSQAGTLLLSNVDNTGTLHADGGRIRVIGLAQWQPGTQTLAGGTYRVNDFGVMALELGSNAQPLRIRINQAAIVLDGPGATLLNRVNDSLAVDAMTELNQQRGSLQLTGGAQLLLGAAGLQQSGSLRIGEGSRLRTEGLFRQTAGATWLSGLLQAPQVALIGGRFGAGLAGTVGQGNVEANVWGLGAGAVLDIDVADAAWDRIDNTGAMALAGSIEADFDIHLLPGASATYRVLQAAGGVTGSFASITHNLDNSLYAVWAEVGSNFVDLHVSAVPEPAGGATTLAGLFGLFGLSQWRLSTSQRPGSTP